jgi:hypothetical protein
VTNRKKYILCQDDDCHWYLIPADKKEEWNEWLDVVQEGDSLPKYAQAVDGPHRLTFENPIEE